MVYSYRLQRLLLCRAYRDTGLRVGCGGGGGGGDDDGGTDFNAAAY